MANELGKVAKHISMKNLGKESTSPFNKIHLSNFCISLHAT
ncbi:hypothetical protein CASFOL_012590 [Castilleja foliolosa]|uniref:Uncharacterized protein n=1 Tax=Castilleja foliolosa TaxID=1961234 RepID=A0ABD3DHH0_9LAMI